MSEFPLAFVHSDVVAGGKKKENSPLVRAAITVPRRACFYPNGDVEWRSLDSAGSGSNCKCFRLSPCLYLSPATIWSQHCGGQ